MSETVSVIITCYNLERYVGAAIESVLRQRFTRPVEVLVIDDCSTDGSANIIKNYGAVSYIRTPANLGVLMATTLGLERASGSLVFLLDGDDVRHPDKLSLAVARFEEDPQLGLLTHDLEYMDGEGRTLHQPSRPSQVMAMTSTTEHEMIRQGILLHADYVWLGSAIAVRRLLIDVGGFCEWARALPDPSNTYQDWPLAFWAASRPEVRMGYLREKLFRYRLHGANHSGDATSAEKALRNIRRAYNTMKAIERIATTSALPDRVMLATERKLNYYRYVLDLYSGHRIGAFRGFIGSLPFLLRHSNNSAKELTRFLGVQLLGLRTFTALVGRVSSRGTSAR